MCKILKTEIFEKSPKAPSEKSVRMLGSEEGRMNPSQREETMAPARNGIETQMSRITPQKAKLK